MASPYPPTRLPRCELCGGTQVGNLAVWGAGLQPTSRTVWANVLSELTAIVCLGCGNSKLFAANLDKVRAEARAHPERFTW